MGIFIDCDGVLADYAPAVERLLGMSEENYDLVYGHDKTHERLRAAVDFYFNLPLTSDAYVLWNGVAHLNPVILTGQPRGDWAREQKLRWRDKHFPGVPMIVTASVDKCDFCKRGDSLIDDRLKYANLWLERGGIFIHHRNAVDTLAEVLKPSAQCSRAGTEHFKHNKCTVLNCTCICHKKKEDEA